MTSLAPRSSETSCSCPGSVTSHTPQHPTLLILARVLTFDGICGGICIGIWSLSVCGFAEWFVVVRGNSSPSKWASKVSPRQSSSRIISEHPDPISYACSLCSVSYPCRCPSHPVDPLQAAQHKIRHQVRPEQASARSVRPSFLEQIEASGEMVQGILTELEEEWESITSALILSVGARSSPANCRMPLATDLFQVLVQGGQVGKIREDVPSTGWVGAHGHCPREADSNVPNFEGSCQDNWRRSEWESEAVEASTIAPPLPSRVELRTPVTDPWALSANRRHGTAPFAGAGGAETLEVRNCHEAGAFSMVQELLACGGLRPLKTKPRTVSLLEFSKASSQRQHSTPRRLGSV